MEWVQTRRVCPERDGLIELSAGDYSEFGDFVNLMQVLEYVWLGNGERAKKLLEVCGEPAGKVADVSVGDYGLVFEDIKLKLADGSKYRGTIA